MPFSIQLYSGVRLFARRWRAGEREAKTDTDRPRLRRFRVAVPGQELGGSPVRKRETDGLGHRIAERKTQQWSSGRRSVALQRDIPRLQRLRSAANKEGALLAEVGRVAASKARVEQANCCVGCRSQGCGNGGWDAPNQIGKRSVDVCGRAEDHNRKIIPGW